MLLLPQHGQLLQQTPVECLVSGAYFRFLSLFGGPPPFDADFSPLLRPSWLSALGPLKEKQQIKETPDEREQTKTNGTAAVCTPQLFVCLLTGETNYNSTLDRSTLPTRPYELASIQFRV